MVDLRNTEAAFLQLRIRQNVPSPSAASVRVARLGVADLFRKLLIIVTLFRKLLIIVTGFIMGIKGVRPVRTRFQSSPPAAGTIQVLRSCLGKRGRKKMNAILKLLYLVLITGYLLETRKQRVALATVPTTPSASAN
jgi:hypothetical protein